MINQSVSDRVSFYSKDNMGLYLSVNDALVACAMASDADEIIGLSDKDLSWGPTAAGMMENDRFVMKNGLTQTFFETSLYKGQRHLFWSFKSPIVGHTGKVLGVQGISVPITDRCLIPLTKQQTACLKELALGFTHKQIGQTLGLAQKTVEHYLDAVKLKLNCKTRSELILQAIERGLIRVF